MVVLKTRDSIGQEILQGFSGSLQHYVAQEFLKEG